MNNRRRRYSSALIAIGLLLSFCQAAAEDEDPVAKAIREYQQESEAEKIKAPIEVDAPAGEINAAKHAITASLKDPDSARWNEGAHVYQVDGKPDEYFCGRVNARNSFGGYVGEQPAWAHIVKSGSTYLIVDQDVSASDEIGYFFKFHPECDPNHWR